jgi:hypothetical protein
MSSDAPPPTKQCTDRIEEVVDEDKMLWEEPTSLQQAVPDDQSDVDMEGKGSRKTRTHAPD